MSLFLASQVPPAQVPPSLLPLPSLAATLKDGGQQVRLHMKVGQEALMPVERTLIV